MYKLKTGSSKKTCLTSNLKVVKESKISSLWDQGGWENAFGKSGNLFLLSTANLSLAQSTCSFQPALPMVVRCQSKGIWGWSRLQPLPIITKPVNHIKVKPVLKWTWSVADTCPKYQFTGHSLVKLTCLNQTSVSSGQKHRSTRYSLWTNLNV